MKCQLFTALATIALLSGCSRSSDSQFSSQQITNNPPRADAQETPAGTLVPTSRPSEATNRIYSSGSDSVSNVEPNNTGRNVRDRADEAITPMDQGGSEADRELTRRIRQALVKDDTLSADAKNIKVITRDGKVTLRGPVASAAEREKIMQAVQGIASGTTVDNQLENKTTNQ